MSGLSGVSRPVLTTAEAAALRNRTNAQDAFVLQLGADHSLPCSWGAIVWNDPATLSAAFNGHMRVYLDRGVTPYLAINTSSGVSHSVTNGMAGLGAGGWDKIRHMAAAGVEIASHSHDHVQAWDAFSAAISIGYVGANATGTVAISATTVTLSAGADSGTIDRSTVPTLAALVAAVNAVTGWSASIPDAAALTGAEATSNLLQISGARDAKTAGDNRFFCVAGGLALSPPMTSALGATRSPVEQLQVQCRTNGWLEVMVNGVREAYVNMGAGLTFAALVTTLNAATGLTQRGITAFLADNGKSRPGGGGFRSYMFGDELAAVLTQPAEYRPILNGTWGGMLSAGLSQSYLRKRQYLRSIEVAAAEGVNITAFAEPGNFWYWRDNAGASPFLAHRGTPLISAINSEAIAYPQCLSDSSRQSWRSSFRYSAGYTTAAHLEAVADAMADSPGLAANILWHSLSDAFGDGAAAGYALGNPALGSEADQDYRPVNAFLARVQTHIAAGRIISAGPTEATQMMTGGRAPKNWLFNPLFRVGAAISGAKTNDEASVPGWLLSTSGAGVAGLTITRTAGGSLVISSPSGATDVTLTQPVAFKPLARYRYGVDVLRAELTGGSGVQIGFVRGDVGRWEQRRVDVGQGQWLEGAAPMTRAGASVGMLSPRSMPQSMRPMRFVGTNGPYNITASNNIFQLSVSLSGVEFSVPLVLTTGAARTAAQVADEINAAVLADPNFAANPEYRLPFAKAERRGRAAAALVLEFPEYVDRVFLHGTLVSNSALTTLFGGAGGDRSMMWHAPADTGDIADKGGVLRLTASVHGVVEIASPFFSAVEVEL